MVLKFNEQLVIPAEGSECICPVITVEVALLVRVKLREELLNEGDSQVEATESILLLQELLEVVEGNLSLAITCSNKAISHSCIFLGQDKANLLNGGEFPVEGAGLTEATTERSAQAGSCADDLGRVVWVLIAQESLEVRHLDFTGFEEIQESEKTIKLGWKDLRRWHLQELNQ